MEGFDLLPQPLTAEKSPLQTSAAGQRPVIFATRMLAESVSCAIVFWDFPLERKFWMRESFGRGSRPTKYTAAHQRATGNATTIVTERVKITPTNRRTRGEQDINTASTRRTSRGARRTRSERMSARRLIAIFALTALLGAFVPARAYT